MSIIIPMIVGKKLGPVITPPAERAFGKVLEYKIINIPTDEKAAPNIISPNPEQESLFMPISFALFYSVPRDPGAHFYHTSIEHILLVQELSSTQSLVLLQTARTLEDLLS